MTMKEVVWRLRAINKRTDSKLKFELALHDKVLKKKEYADLPNIDDEKKKLLELASKRRLTQNGK